MIAGSNTEIAKRKKKTYSGTRVPINLMRSATITKAAISAPTISRYWLRVCRPFAENKDRMPSVICVGTNKERLGVLGKLRKCCIFATGKLAPRGERANLEGRFAHSFGRLNLAGDPYQELGVSRTATAAEIRKAWLTYSKDYDSGAVAAACKAT